MPLQTHVPVTEIEENRFLKGPLNFEANAFVKLIVPHVPSWFVFKLKALYPYIYIYISGQVPMVRCGAVLQIDSLEMSRV